MVPVDPVFLALPRTPPSASCPAVTLPESAEAVCAATLSVPASQAMNTRQLTLIPIERRGMTNSLVLFILFMAAIVEGRFPWDQWLGTRSRSAAFMVHIKPERRDHWADLITGGTSEYRPGQK